MTTPPSDETFSRILRETRTIALVGASNKPARPAYQVMEYLLSHGYHVVPVNPGLAGGEILGQTVYASLDDVPAPIDMVDIFRNSDAAGEVAEHAIALKDDKAIKGVWMQIGVVNETAAQKVHDSGMWVVQDHCPKIEHARLLSDD